MKRQSVDQYGRILTLPKMDDAARLSTAFAFTGVSLNAHLTGLRRDAFTPPFRRC